MSSKRDQKKKTTETVCSENNNEGLLMNLCLKLKSNPQIYIVEAVWAAEVSPLKIAPYSRKTCGDIERTGFCGSCTQIGNSIRIEVTV